ncbi:MAG: 50S ribosomal protein L17 [Bacteroidota bacterium]
MRHGKKFNHLGRQQGHRRALLKNLSIALITHKRITTTLAKAKALRRHVEPLITKAKDNTTHSRRVVFSYLQSKTAVKELFGPVVAKVGDRPGGYVRIIKTGFRKSDGAEMAMIELVDFNELLLSAKASGESQSKSGRKRRTRRGRRSGGAENAAAATSAVEESQVEESDAADAAAGEEE